eukprot:CAMPEP_0115234662 /NCGR_PEP_ID=MMETSP0270-20121206/34908_1 /TAXON_ID=71861 /ORGANISM="Scrippsiella trochoidea, Strain CCMP3099" /LENGTH=121 /DNA_ID=CAMNT_0002649415 /DNA_START=1582 /DNA_END=1948 /DNA_ORIENTATION=-
MTSISIPVHLQLTSFGTSSSKVFCHDEAINETCITNNVTVENGASTLGPNWRPELLLVMVTGSLVLNITNVEPYALSTRSDVKIFQCYKPTRRPYDDLALPLLRGHGVACNVFKLSVVENR